MIGNEPTDTGEYYLSVFVNALRFIVLAIILSSIGIKSLFKDYVNYDVK